MSTCKEVIKDDRKIIIFEDLEVSMPVEYTIPTPIFCDCCDYPMRSQEDHVTYKESKCCAFCDMYFVKPYNEKWLASWRPTKEEILNVKRRQVSSPTT